MIEERQEPQTLDEFSEFAYYEICEIKGDIKFCPSYYSAHCGKTCNYALTRLDMDNQIKNLFNINNGH